MTAWRALWGVFGCAGLFTLLFVVLYLWLFYRIFSKAGYSGWYTLLNLIPYVGSVIVVFMLAFGDWPALRRQGPGSYGPAGGYPPPPGPGYGGPSRSRAATRLRSHHHRSSDRCAAGSGALPPACLPSRSRPVHALRQRRSSRHRRGARRTSSPSTARVADRSKQ